MLKRTVSILVLALAVVLPHRGALTGLPTSKAGPSDPPVVAATQLAARPHGYFQMSEGFALYPLGMDWVDNSRHGQWRDRFGGYGRVGITVDQSRVLSEVPKRSRHPSETHAGLVTSLKSFGDFDLTLKMKTIRQLRTPTPNPWEMAWVLWHYTDQTHFYYLVLKTNGWELGKEDPAYPGNQRFLITRSYPRFRPGPWYTVHIRQVGRRMTIWVGRRKLGSFADYRRPYWRGTLGLYCEDSQVEFDNVLVR